MRKYENNCVGCPPDMGCIGISCPYRNVSVNCCDLCESEIVKYIIDGEDYCENCAEQYLQEVFDELTLKEKAEALNVDLSDIS